MAVGGEQNFDELLKQLSAVKRLPASSQPFRTQEAAFGSQASDIVRSAFAKTPRLGEAVQQIQQGGSAQTGWKGAVARAVGSPAGKVVLGGLNIIDMPRRAVISTVKEFVDATDSNPETRASLSEGWQQFKDPSFGFGRVVPMKGWKGRIVGLIGDIALDPTTYLTLGGTVPTKAVALSARSAEAAGLVLRPGAKALAEDVLLRAALGTKNVTGREGRFALANLVKQYGGTAEEIARVASHGKSAVPADIAKVMGLQRNGLYMFGSRVRLPGSGRIGGALESGLVKSRLWATNTNVGKKLQYLYTPRGASGRMGDFSKYRADLASGRLDPEKANLIVSSLGGVERGRARGASFGAQSLRDAVAVGQRDEVRQFDDQIHRFVEAADPSLLSPSETAAKRAFQEHMARQRELMVIEGRKLDPEFDIPIGMADEVTGEVRYFPHIATDEYVRHAQRNPTDPWVVKMEQVGSVDVLDMKNNLAARHFRAGDEFLETGYVLKTGSVDEINAAWRRETGNNFDLFETSATKVMAKYSDTVRGAFEAFTLLDDLKSDDFIRLLRSQGEIDPEYLKSLESMVSTKMADVQRLSGRARASAEELVRVVKQQFSTDYRRSAASTLKNQVADIGAEARLAEAGVKASQDAVVAVQKLEERLKDVVSKQQVQVRSLAAMFEENNLVIGYMEDAVNRGIEEGFELGRQAEGIRRLIADQTASADELENAIVAFEQRAKDVALAQERAEKILDYYRIYGDELGPALQDIYDRIRSASSDADTAAMIRAGENWQATGDVRVDRILSKLMKPFDNIEYQNTSDLGEDWLRDSLNSTGEVGALLNTIPDLGDPAGGRATRASMARSGTKKRHLTARAVNQIIGRASTVGDNPEAVADAFFFMTARELRASYDNVGGGVAGLAAQEALAQELRAGTSSRARMWQEARQAVDYIAQQRKVLAEIGSKKTQSGKYQFATQTIERIEDLESQIQQARESGLAVAQGVSSALDNLKLALNNFADGSSKGALDFGFKLRTALDEAVRAKPELADFREWHSLDWVANKTQGLIAEGQAPTKDGLKELYGRVDAMIRSNFTNDAEVKRLTAAKEALEREASDALKLDKRFTETSNELLESSRDAGIKLSNYHIIHATRLSIDAIAALTPSDAAVGDALYKFALAGAARQQLSHVVSFERTRNVFENAISDVRNKVLSTPRQEWALSLREAIDSLPEFERDAVYSIVGDLSFIEKNKAVATRIEAIRRNNEQYVAVRDQIIDMLEGPDWKRQVEIERSSAYSRVQRRAAIYRDSEQAAELGSEDVVLGSEAEMARQSRLLSEAKNRINSFINATPKKLNEMIDTLVERGTVTASEADGLRWSVNSAEAAAKQAQKEALKRAGATGKGAREAARIAAGAARSGDETYGLARAYFLATRTNSDGSTMSPQRVSDFFTQIFGEGDIRVSNSGGWKRPSPELSGEEVLYRKKANAIIGAAKKQRDAEVAALRSRGITGTARADAESNIRLAYWQKLSDELGVDMTQVSKLLQDLDDANEVVRMRSAAVRAARANDEEVGTIIENQRLLDASKKRVSNIRGQLATVEREAGQLVTRGTSSPEQTFKFISYGDSVLGRTGKQIQLRSAALRTLARDPEAAVSFNLGVGIDAGLNRAEVLSGPYGEVEFLRGRVAELEAAENAVSKARKELSKQEAKVERASAVRRQAVADAEAIANNPVLSKRVEDAVNVVSDNELVRTTAERNLMSPQSKTWLGSERLGANKGRVPERVSRLVNEIRNTKRKIVEIQKTAEYTTAVEREFRHKFLMTLARLNLADASLEFPQKMFDENTIGALRFFANKGGGYQAGINPDSVLVFTTREIPQEQIIDKILNSKADKYVFVVGDRRVTEQAVRDASVSRLRGKFRYTAEVVDDTVESSRLDAVTGRSIVERSSTKKLVYVDKSTGKKFAFGEDAGQIVDGQELVFDQPIYLGRNQQLSDEYQLVTGGNLTVLQKQERLSITKDGASFYDPSQAHALFTSPNGERVYRMDSIVGMKAPRGADPLDPSVVFDAAQGRGIRDNFDALFTEPANPLSPRGKKLRADLAAKREELGKVSAKHSKHLDDMANASSEGARRAAQRKAATLSEQIEVLNKQVTDLEKNVANSSPVTHMVTVENAMRVIDYFRNNPELLNRLGVKVDVPPTTVDAFGRTVRVAGPAMPANDEQVLKAFDTYVTALEHNQMRPKEGYRKAGIEKSNVVPQGLLDSRKKFLTGVWNASPEGTLLATHRGMNRKVAALVKELGTIRSGGDAAELSMSLRAARDELSRTERVLGLQEKELGKVLKAERPKVTRLEGETVAQAAARVAADKERAISQSPIASLTGALSADAQDAARREVDTLASYAWFDEAFSQDAKASLMSIRASIAGRESILESLKGKEYVLMERLDAMTKVIEGGTLTPAQAARLGDEFKDLRMQLNGTRGVPGLKKKIADAQGEISKLHAERMKIEAKLAQERSAVDSGFYANLNLDDARRRIDLVKSSLEDMRGIRNRATVGKAGKNDAWMRDFDEFAAEVDDLLQRLNSLPDGPDTKRLASVVTGYTEAKANLLREQAELSELQIMAKNGSMFAPGSHIVYSKVLDDGWMQLTGSGSLKNFKNLQMRPEVAEILSNMGRLRDPVFVKQMNAWFGPYTRFFKAWALSTPGYHIRNSITNAFMLVAAGGRPTYLAEGMREYNALYKALKSGVSVEKYLSDLPVARRTLVERAYNAMLGSGVGQTEEIAFDSAGLLTNNPWTRGNRRVGVWVEQHSRFMLSYDGVKQGLDVNGATARTRKFLFDYEDISTLDTYMRSIIPFWMWTSRNLPLTVQNVYMNPRAYQWYGNIRRNIEDREKTEGLPLYMRESGSFSLPGTTLAATPDLGFNRMQADVAMITDPLRLAANVNPALRVPVELLAGKSFFRNRAFSEQPVEVSGPVGRLASILGRPLGKGQSVDGKQYVDENLLYALTNAVPLLNTAERFIPSQEYYKQRGSTNPLLGFLGAPVRQITPEMTASEQRRRLAEMQKVLRVQPQPEGQ